MALRPSGERWAVPNEARGGATRVDRGPPLPPPLLVLAATGGLGRGRSARGRRPPAPGPRWCPGHGPVGHNGGGGCAGPSPLCRRAPPAAPAAAQTQALRALLGRRQPL